MEKEKVEKVVIKITTARNKKGYNYENMAHDLSITPAAYRKIETGETKLTLERLFNNETATGYQQKIENFYQENREVYEKLLQSKDEQIMLLKDLLEKK